MTDRELLQQEPVLNGAGKPTLSSEKIRSIASNYFSDDDSIIKCGIAMIKAFEYAVPTTQKPLTDKQIGRLIHYDMNRFDFARAIEAAHGIKGEKND